MIKTLSILCTLLLITLSGVQAAAYDYPLDNPYAATVVGTPRQYQAPLPKRIRIRTLELPVFEDRKIPELFWHSQHLRYSLAYQQHRAPLIFIIAGTGAGYNSDNMQVMQRAFFQAGFHVLSLSSPTHPNFIAAASSSSVPGDLAEDSRDLYRVMGLAWQQVRDRIEVSEFHLTGYSLGAAQAAYIAKIDEERRLFNFGKVLMINPPVSLYNSVAILDDLLKENIPGGLEGISDFIDEAFNAFAEVYKAGDFLDLAGDFLYAAYRQKQPSDDRLAALIGIAFRLSSANLVFTSDVMNNSGYIKPKHLNLSTSDSLTDYYKVSVRVSFLDYFSELFTPNFQSRHPNLTEQTLIDNSSLKRIEDYLRRADKIALMHNEDDLILAPGELDYLRRVFQARARIYPHGGHCGNLAFRDNIAHMIAFFKG